MNNILGLVISLVYIGFVLLVATLVAKKEGSNSEVSRKIVHILVGNWVFITPFFDNVWALLLVPFSFIIINSLSLKYNLISAMERDDDSLGTVYYAISLFVLSALSFTLKWPELLFIGGLIMAYGDGFAAISGQKLNSSTVALRFGSKTWAGSITLGIISFLVTFFILIYFYPTKWIIILLVSLLTSLFSVYIELASKQGCDNLSLPITSSIFAVLLFRYFSLHLVLYLILCVFILFVAEKRKSITADGSVGAMGVAISLYTLGSPALGYSLLGFFVLGTLVSKLSNSTKLEGESRQLHTGARNWVQVLSNSLPAVILMWASLFSPSTKPIFLLIAFGVFSCAAADTFSSEIGMLSKGKVYNILTFKEVNNGVSGGVSLLGLGAGLVGSFLLSLFAFSHYSIKEVLILTLFGFISSLLDSILGSLVQAQYKNEIGNYQDKPVRHNQKVDKGINWMSNNMVNLLTLSIMASVFVLVSLF